MNDGQFSIQFDYQGLPCIGIVTPGERENLTFVVEYWIPEKEPKTIEICISERDQESDAIVWQQQVEEVGEIAGGPALIAAIGEAIVRAQM